MLRFQTIDFLKVLRKMILPSLAVASAVLNAPVALAKSPDTAAPAPWKVSNPIRLANVVVTIQNYAPNPTYFMKLPSGETIELVANSQVSAKGLTPEQIKIATNDTRDVLEAVASLVLSRVNTPSAVIHNNYAVATVVNPEWARQNKAVAIWQQQALVANYGQPQKLLFDPIAAVLDGEIVPGAGDSTGTTARERTVKFMKAIVDAVITSAYTALKQDRAGTLAMKGRWQETGFQVGLRLDLQIGLGKLNITKNLPVMLSFGYNRAKRTVVFRRGFRSEKMAAGTAFQVGSRIELRGYVLHADEVSAADPRASYSKIEGKSWYPPAIPFLSFVSDTAPGYVSKGVSFNVMLLFGPVGSVASTLAAAATDPSFLMNTVTDFQETQREYSKKLPNAPDWMKQFQQKVADSSESFSGGARTCRAVFR